MPVSSIASYSLSPKSNQDLFLGGGGKDPLCKSADLVFLLSFIMSNVLGCLENLWSTKYQRQKEFSSKWVVGRTVIPKYLELQITAPLFNQYMDRDTVGFVRAHFWGLFSRNVIVHRLYSQDFHSFDLLLIPHNFTWSFLIYNQTFFKWEPGLERGCPWRDPSVSFLI